MGLRIEKRLREAMRPDMVQVAPNKWQPRNQAVKVPDVALASFVQEDDGTYSAIPFQERMARISPNLTEILGLGRGAVRTIKRLGRAGFIEVLQVSPRFYVLNLDSYFNHLRRVAEDPWFWENKDNLREYQENIGEV